MLKLTFIRTGVTNGDDTSPYNIYMNQECTVGEFIDCVLTQKEWGYIKIKRQDIYGTLLCEYKGDKVVRTEIPEEYLSKKIASVLWPVRVALKYCLNNIKSS